MRFEATFKIEAEDLFDALRKLDRLPVRVMELGGLRISEVLTPLVSGEPEVDEILDNTRKRK